MQLMRALFAVIAAVMITFTTDHSAAVGFSVFSGFAIATGLVHLAAVWLVYPPAQRAVSTLLGVLTLLAGMVGGLAPLRTPTMFFAVVILWALLTGLVETLAGARGLRAARRAANPRPLRPGEVAPWTADGEPIAPPPVAQSRDALSVGILTLILGFALLFVPTGYALTYTIAEAGTFVLSGTGIAVGVFGGYAAIVAVFLGIAAFSPRARTVESAPIEEAV